jgi:hypothetical protein
MTHCTDACAGFGWATGSSTDASGNTLGCRIDHALLATGSATAAQCRDAGPVGFTVCGTTNCDDFCNADVAVCGTMAYADLATCLSVCAGWTDSSNPDLSSPSGQLACRVYHLTNAAHAGAAAGHCPHTSAGGGGVCPP